MVFLKLERSLKYIFFSIAVILSISFLVFLFWFSLNYLPAMDDFCYLNQLKTDGFVNTFRNIFLNWSGRWAATGINLFGLSIYSHISTFFPYFFIVFSIELIALLKISSLFIASLRTRIIMALVMLICGFILTPEKTQTWLWATGSSAHLAGPIFMLTGFAFACMNGKNILKISGSLCLIIATGCSESCAILIPFVSALISVYFFYTRRKYEGYYWVLNGLLTISSALFLFTSTGNLHRTSALFYFKRREISQMAFLEYSWFFKFLLARDKSYWILVTASLLTFIPFAESGIMRSINIKKIIFFLLGLYPVFFVIWFAPMIYVYGNLGPPRSWGLTGFYFTGLAAISGICLSSILRSQLIKLFAGICGISLIGFYLFKYCIFPTIKEYPAYKTVFSNVLTHPNDCYPDKIQSMKLPPSGIIMKQNFGISDSDRWANDCLCNALNRINIQP